MVGRAATAARPLLIARPPATAARLSFSALNHGSSLPITGAMTLEATLERVSAIRQALADPAALIGSGGALTGGTKGPSAPGATGESSFAAAQAGERRL